MELDITWGRTIRVWWSYLWRNLIATVLAMILGAILGGFMGFILGFMGFPVIVIKVIVMPIAALMGLAISVVPMKMVLGKDFGEFRLVLLAKEKERHLSG